MRYRVLSPWTIAAWAVLIVLVGAGVAVWLLLGFTGGNVEANRVQLDAVRTAGTIVVGTGGAAALLLAARRQRSAEIALKQKDRDQADVARAHALQERTALASEADAAARRITDLYTKAADQLGSEKAPVRLAGLYALERLAQDNPSQRQTIANVLCAYLRMSYTQPGDPPADNTDNTVTAVYRERVQEREVRLTAQRILAHHLRPGDPAQPVETFWADLDVDLTGAILIDLKFNGCHTHTATFTQAQFIGSVLFGGVHFSDARFDEAQFTGDAEFDEAQFTGETWFSGAQFTGDTRFYGAQFTGRAWLNGARFTGHARFDGAQFTRDVLFSRTQFTGGTVFTRAQFTGNAWFNRTRFTGETWFREARFTGNAWFSEAQFTCNTGFGGARFTGNMPPEVAPFWSPPLPTDDPEQQEEAAPTG